MKAEKALKLAIDNCKEHIKKVEKDIETCVAAGEVEMKLWKVLPDNKPLPGAVIQWLKMQEYDICDSTDCYLVSWKYKRPRNH